MAGDDHSPLRGPAPGGARRFLVGCALAVALAALPGACAKEGAWPKLAGPLPQAPVPPPPKLTGPAPQPIVRFADRAAAVSWVEETERRLDTWQQEITVLSVRDLPARIRPEDLKLWGEAQSRLTRLHRIEGELLEADLKREAAEARLIGDAAGSAQSEEWRARLARLADRLHRMEATVATHRQALEARLGNA